MPLHVLINNRRGSGRALVFNKDEDWVRRRVVEPWEKGEDIVLNGSHWSPGNIQVTIRETPAEVAGADAVTTWINLNNQASDRTNDLLDKPAGSQAPGQVPQFAEDRRKVMVVVGRDARLNDSLFQLLRALNVQPLEWTKLVGTANNGAPYIGQVLDVAFSQCQAVVVLSTPDDIAYLRHDLVPEGDPMNERLPRGQARPNVFYEAGMAMGRFPTRTVFVEVGIMRPASDLDGIHAVRRTKGPSAVAILPKG